MSPFKCAPSDVWGVRMFVSTADTLATPTRLRGVWFICFNYSLRIRRVTHSHPVCHFKLLERRVCCAINCFKPVWLNYSRDSCKMLRQKPFQSISNTRQINLKPIYRGFLLHASPLSQSTGTGKSNASLHSRTIALESRWTIVDWQSSCFQ